jgi:ribosome-binding factor A
VIAAPRPGDGERAGRAKANLACPRPSVAHERRTGAAILHIRPPMSRSELKHAGPSHRVERVAEAVRHAVADILQRGEIADPALDRQGITVPVVRMSNDLKHATVTVMPLGGKNAEATIAALKANAKMLRAMVAHRVNLKFAPELRFELDRTFAAHDAIDALLKSPRVARDLRHDDEGEGDR